VVYKIYTKSLNISYNCTIFSGIKSKYNLGGKTGLFQAVRLNTQSLIKKFCSRFGKYLFGKNLEMSAL